MPKITRSTRRGNLADLPLFDWAATRVVRPASLPYPARWLRHRFPGLSPARARLVVELAGLGGEVL